MAFSVHFTYDTLEGRVEKEGRRMRGKNSIRQKIREEAEFKKKGGRETGSVKP